MKFICEVCDPNKEIILGVQMKKGSVCEIIHDHVYHNDENQLKITIGLLFIKLVFKFNYEKI